MCTEAAAFGAALGALCQPGLGRTDAHEGPVEGKPPLCSARSTRGSLMGQVPFMAQLDISPSMLFPNLYYHASMLREKGGVWIMSS